MSTLRVTTNQSVIRLTPEGDSPQVILSSAESTIKLSEVGVQGPRGFSGPAGQDGSAEIPDVLDGGNF